MEGEKYVYLQLVPVLQILRTEDPAVLTQNGRLLIGKNLTDEQVVEILRAGIQMPPESMRSLLGVLA